MKEKALERTSVLVLGDLEAEKERQEEGWGDFGQEAEAQSTEHQEVDVGQVLLEEVAVSWQPKGVREVLLVAEVFVMLVAGFRQMGV